MSSRRGVTLCDVLVALVLVSASAAWALHAALTTTRAAGAAGLHQAAITRASRALATLQSAPCDSASATVVAHEPRWTVISTRTRAPAGWHDMVTVRTHRGDTVTVGRHRWCTP